MKKIYQTYIQILIALLAAMLINSCNDDSYKTNNIDKGEISSYAYKIRKNEDSLDLFLQKSIADNNTYGKLYAYRLIGNYQRENASFTKAISSHQNELETALSLNDTIEIIQAMNNLGTDLRRVGALSEAADYHYRALDYSEAFSESYTNSGIKNKVVSLNGIGNVSLSLGYYDEAKSYFMSALEDEKKLKSPIGQAINYANIGAIYELTHDYDSARIYYEYSLEQNIIGKSDMGIGLCYIHFGNIHRKKGEYAKAKVEYRKAYDLMEDISDRWHWLEACISIAEINYLTHNLNDYLHYINLAEKVAEEIESPEHLSQIYKLKHDYELSQNNYQKALTNYKQSILMQDSVQGVKRNSQFLDLRVSYERNKYNRSISQLEAENRAESGKKRVMLYIMLLTTITGAIITLVLFYAYRERSRSNDMLRQLEKTRSEFFTGITHEFRTPLTVILGLAEIIESKDEDKANAGSIIKQANILLDMVNQLLEMARIKSRLDKSKWVNGDLVAFMDMNVEAFRSYATAKGVDLILTSNERVLLADFIPVYFERVVVNILSNALKHTPKGGQITVSVSKQHESVKVSVSDTGPGINPQDLPHIFQEFYVGNNSDTASSGSGIGLALVYKMMDAMNGNIKAENIESGGAKFIITLPIKQKFEIKEQWGGNYNPQLPFINTISSDSLSKYDEEISNGDTSTHKPSILVVEDNSDIQAYIGSLLNEKYIVRFASNGEEGLTKASNFLPDLIITDLMMPVMDGFELAEHIRHDQVLNHIPIVVITAKTSDEDKQRAYKIGADAYLFKPFNANELRLRVQKLLEQRQMLRNKYSKAMLEGDSEKVDLSNDDRDFLNRVISIIYEDISDSNLSADTVADRVFMSRSQLNRKIRQITGYSISAFILHTRLEKSKRMLRTDNTRIGDIAMSCGFEDSNYFSRVFKQVYKVSPSQYRKTPKAVN